MSAGGEILNHIKKLRKEAGYKTANEVCEILNVSISTIRKIEASYRKPSLKLAHKLAKTFNCSIEDIVSPYQFTMGDETNIPDKKILQKIN